MTGGLIEERVRIGHGARSLSGMLVYPTGATRFAALLVHPHPYMGGRTGNALMERLARDLAAGGGVVLSFDYRGAGPRDGAGPDLAQSMSLFWHTGTAPEDPRMIDDVRLARAWLARVTDLPWVAVGYSFGAFAVAASLSGNGSADVPLPSAIVLISPTAGRHDFPMKALSRVPKLVVYCDDDFATDTDTIERWIGALPEPKRSVRFSRGNHFFRGMEGDVARACLGFVDEVLDTRRSVEEGVARASSPCSYRRKSGATLTSPGSSTGGRINPTVGAAEPAEHGVPSP